MSVVQAAELLGVLPGAPAHEIRRRYHKIYNDYQVRLANAPTPSLRRLYQRNLQEIQAAAELLSPGVVRDG
jgi:phosphate starvation-inducible protein PhoH